MDDDVMSEKKVVRSCEVTVYLAIEIMLKVLPLSFVIDGV